VTMLVIMMPMFMAMRMPVFLFPVFCYLLPDPRSLAFHNHVHFGSRQAPAHHSALLQPRANIQRSGSLGQQLKGNSRIHKGAKQHIAADAGKALKVSNSHRVVILNGRQREVKTSVFN